MGFSRSLPFATIRADVQARRGFVDFIEHGRWQQQLTSAGVENSLLRLLARGLHDNLVVDLEGVDRELPPRRSSYFVTLGVL